jgi:malate dehydrogenase
VEVLKAAGVFNPQRTFGVTTLDVVRASTFVAHVLGEKDPRKFSVSVVGGHSGATILPLFSQSKPSVELTKEQLDAITHSEYFRMSSYLRELTICSRSAVWWRRNCQIQGWSGISDDMYGLRGLSVSYINQALFTTRCSNIYRFAQAIMKALQGEIGIIEPAYVYLPGVPGGKDIAESLGVDYFAVPIEFSIDGASKALPVGKLSEYESGLLKIAVEELKSNITKGIVHVAGTQASTNGS